MHGATVPGRTELDMAAGDGHRLGSWRRTRRREPVRLRLLEAHGAAEDLPGHGRTEIDWAVVGPAGGARGSEWEAHGAAGRDYGAGDRGGGAGGGRAVEAAPVACATGVCEEADGQAMEAAVEAARVERGEKKF